MYFKDQVLDYHSQGRRGKLEVVPYKPCSTQRDLSMAYTPGVALPCLEIKENGEEAYNYTMKGNLVAVVSNGTAVLGLGNIGAVAGKPVMEGKGVLFKRFADIDVFDIELNTEDPDEMIRAVQLMEPTFGGINLEDIKAPECFYIEEQLKKSMNIPVFHDDQHGTAIISGAALLNACELAGKKLEDVRVVVNGAGAAGIACTNLYVALGVKKEHILMCDSKGVIYKGRKERMNPYKENFAADTERRTLADAMKGADVFCGVSVKDCVTPKMVQSMADSPVIFAMANPDPEITYDEAKAAREDVIIATGRSDFPNQVNNVLGFPFIFRGTLDVRARAINDEMKIAASRALAQLAKEDVPDAVCKAYDVERLSFGRDYIIPKPFDPRVLLWVTPAVAKAAMDTGVAGVTIDLNTYRDQLEARLGKSREMMRMIINKAMRETKRVVYPEGENDKILRAATIVKHERIATPVLLGRPEVIRRRIQELQLELDEVEIINPPDSPRFEEYCREFHTMRQRKGFGLDDVRQLMSTGRIYAPMMVKKCDADCVISGLTMARPDTLRPALWIIRKREEVDKVAGMYMLLFKNKIVCCADTTINIDPTAEELAGIAVLTAETVRRFNIEPRVAMLSFSSFGSVNHPLSRKVKRAVEIAKAKEPALMIDGEMQADLAVVPEMLEEEFPFSTLEGGANVLIFPDLASSNIAYKLLMRLGCAEAIGPILMGFRKSFHVVRRNCEVNDIVNMTAIAVVEAQDSCEE